MTPKPKPRRIQTEYRRRGVLAIDPSAFLDVFFVDPVPPANDKTDPRGTVVTIRGPLDQHAGGIFDSYEAILERVASACEEPSPAIVLAIDSPGGDAQGVFECVREIRALCEANGKYLVAHVEGKGCSAAYALACVAHKLVLGATAIVGSIGVLATRPDVSMRNALDGLHVSFIASGARKADGHIESPTTLDELEAMQRIVDSMAGVFFELVSEMRGLSVEAIAAQNGSVFHGEAAIAAGLGDETRSLNETLARLASWRTSEKRKPQRTEGTGTRMQTKPNPSGNATSRSSYASIRADLAAMATGDGNSSRRAKRALAALESTNAPATPARRAQPSAAAETEDAEIRRTPEDERARRMLDERFGLLAPNADIRSVQSTPFRLTFGAGARSAFAPALGEERPRARPQPAAAPQAEPSAPVRTPEDEARKGDLDMRFGLLEPNHRAVVSTATKLTLGGGLRRKAAPVSGAK